MKEVRPTPRDVAMYPVIGEAAKLGVVVTRRGGVWVFRSAARGVDLRVVDLRFVHPRDFLPDSPPARGDQLASG